VKRSALATVLEPELRDGYGGVPAPPVPDHGVQDDEELSHAGGLGAAAWLSLAAEPLVYGADHGVPAWYE
jgi:hypothetical protein